MWTVVTAQGWRQSGAARTVMKYHSSQNIIHPPLSSSRALLEAWKIGQAGHLGLAGLLTGVLAGDLGDDGPEEGRAG